MACPELATADGFELQLGTNHLGHFLLTHMLLPLLGAPTLGSGTTAAEPAAPREGERRRSRIVTVSSAAHLFGHVDFEDLQSRRGYNPWKAYGQSKLVRAGGRPPGASAGALVRARSRSLACWPGPPHHHHHPHPPTHTHTHSPAR
jgi:NAD(P)-dependent dehydrogenase (short-subunit alcohol dehydrogenase family)